MNFLRPAVLISLAAIGVMQPAEAAQVQGGLQRGAQAFGACAACHSVLSGEHMTGPSLAHIWGRKAGSAKAFMRYSDALKNADVIWNEQTLDKWLANPAGLIPGNAMSFEGIKDAKARRDLIAYLKAVSEGKAPAATRQGGGMMGGGMMGGGMMGGARRSSESEKGIRGRRCRFTDASPGYLHHQDGVR